MPHSYETAPIIYWVLTIFAVLKTNVGPEYWKLEKIGKIPAAHQGYFQTLESPSQGQAYFLCGDFSDRTVPPVYQTDSGYTLQLVYLLVFGSPVVTYPRLQSKPEDRDEKMASKVQQR